ncbi:Nop52 domain-containing protein [Phanerochaete sordida]|uniref:Nop52 domain-containing protein n=1 Tax=Phanerochaete sordida TaxID=48140 RepID=A0A9P3L9V5_9APHY|nr:Nop52 domain-containing protein [Phanerochaete sordida]
MAATASSSSDVPPLGKYLASNDKKTRDRAVKSLSAFLCDPSHDDLPKSELAKLWKGIFYCFWMSDKPLVQQALASEIAEIALQIPKTPAALAFLRGFWEALVREWPGIDRHRLDKYYMLVRRFVNASFRLLIRDEWDASVCTEYNTILSDKGGPLCPEDPRVPVGLAYHLADIYIEELDKALAAAEDPLPAPLGTLVAPFLALAARTPTKAAYDRLQSALLEPLLGALAPASPSEDEEGERRRKRARLASTEFEHLVQHMCVSQPKDGAVPAAVVRKALLKQIFDVAGEESTRDANRRKLFALYKSHTDEDDEDES